MKNTLARIAVLAVFALVASVGAAETSYLPSLAYLGANRACQVERNWGFGWTTLDLTTTNSMGGGSYYSTTAPGMVSIDANSKFRASQTGYVTLWKTYPFGLERSDVGDGGPLVATNTFATGSTVELSGYKDKKWSLGRINATFIYVFFSPIAYSLAYNLTSGSWPEDYTPPFDATYDKPFTVRNPVREGYAFSGWQVDETNFYVRAESSQTFSNLTTTANATVSFKAKWSVVGYDLALSFGEGVARIWYRVGNGDWLSATSSTTVQVPYGTTWSAYCETTQHWVLTGVGESRENCQKGTMTTAGDSFVPRPTRREYDLSLSANPPAGGTVRPTSGKYAYESESKCEVEATAQTGWKFARWSDGSLENPHRFTMLSDTNVWAKFEKNTYKVAFTWQGADGKSVTEIQTVAYGDSAVEPGAEKRNVYAGHAFKSWNNTTWQTVTGDLNIKADYSANSYTLKFVGNGATSGAMSDQTFDYDEKTKKLSTSQFGRTGYVFAGWSREPNGSIAFSDADDVNASDLFADASGAARDSGAELSLYAVWEPITYQIAFDAGEGGQGTMTNQTVAYDAELSLPPCGFTHKSGQAFIRWTDASGRSYTNCETIVRLAETQDALVTLTAEWTTVGTVTFKGEGGEMVEQSYNKNENFSLRANPFAKTGYHFVEWKDDDGASYSNQQVVAFSTDRVNLTAVFRANSYQVSFDPNGGSGSMAPTNLAYGAEASIGQGFKPPADGWTFVGWSTNKTSPVLGQPISNLTADRNGHVKLYAIWQFNLSPESLCVCTTSNLNFKQVVQNPINWTGYTNDTDGCYLKFTGVTTGQRKPGAPLFAEMVSNVTGVLSFDWRAESTKTTIFNVYVGGSNGLAGAICGTISTNGIEKLSTLTNACENTKEWHSVTCRIEVLCDNATLAFACITEGRFTKSSEWFRSSIRNVRWTPDATTNDVDVVFDLGGGTCGGASVVTQRVDVGCCALEPTVTPAPGYALAGWKVGELEIPVNGVATNVITGATRYEAVYANRIYQILYENTRGKENPNLETFDLDDSLTLEPLQETDGSKAAGFLGWSPAELVKGTTSNIVVTAQWAGEEKVFHTLTFVSGPDADPTYDKVQVEDGKNAVVPEPTARPGYLFLGWVGTVDNVTADGTVQATYEAIEYPIVYENTRGLGNATPPLNRLSYNVNDEFVLEPLALEAADTNVFFVGWLPTDRVQKGTTGELTFTAQWTSRYPKITINGETRSYVYGETVTESTSASVEDGGTNLVCTGWIGSGCVPASGATNTVTFTVTQEGSLTWLYATNYCVRATAKTGGTVALRRADGGIVSNPGWFAPGTRLTAEATPAEGWSFKDWTSVGTFVAPTGTLAAIRADGAVTLTAVFTQKVHAVTFLLDEQLARTGGGALEQSVVHGQSAQLPTVKSTNANYLFDGWYDENGEPVVASSLLNITGSRTIRGRATKSAYSLTVSVADGCGKMGTVSGGKSTVKAGAKVTIKATAKTGCVFAGWYLASACVSQTATYSFSMPKDDLDFEAKFLAKKSDWATISVGAVSNEYAKGVAIAPVAVTAAGGSLPSVKATGLPTGLALKNGVISGTPKRSGIFASKLTATTAGKATASTNVTFVVVDRAKGENIVSTEVVLLDAEGLRVSGSVPGKTTGQGVYAKGKKVTLKATANKGFVFSGWYDANINLVSRLSSLALVVPDSDLAYTAAFVTTDDDAANISAHVNGMELVAPDAIETIASTGKTVETNVSAGVYLQWPVVAAALSSTTVSVSGLPSGLKFTAKAITSKVTSYDASGKRVTTVVTNVPAMTIYGTPTAASKVNAKTGVVTPSRVKVTVTTAGKNKATGVILLTVDPISSELIGTFTGGSTNEPIGSASVTLASSGKISGKWISEGLTWTLSAKGFDIVDADVSSARTKYVATNVTAKSGKLVETLTLVFSVNDLGYGEVVALVDADSALGDAESLRVAEDSIRLFSATYVPWKKDAALKALASELKGKTFVVASDDGTTLTGKVGANGTVSVAGSFDVGAAKPYTATVSSTLVPIDGDLTRFEVFVCFPYKKNKFDGYATTLIIE